MPASGEGGPRRLVGRGVTTVVLTAAALAAGALLAWWLHATQPSPEVRPDPSRAVDLTPGTERPDFTLPDLEGRLRQVGEWDGKVLVVNFWATWCPPCLREIPHFVELQRRHATRGLQFLGVAVDDPDAVSAYAEGIGVNYPILVLQAGAAELSGRYGNRFGALPYTAIVDRQGRLVAARAGEIRPSDLEAIVTPLL
jgi:thiol-disulfide isomerase/thioredoxin